jgi:predicted nucleotidyltransferase
MTVNSDYADLLCALNDAGAEFLIVGAYAVIHYTEPRYTKDLDLWIRPSADNAERVHAALTEFGAPLDNLTTDDLCDPTLVFQIGLEPVRIDIFMGLPGLDFEEVWTAATKTTFGEIPIRVMSREHLIAVKTRAGRPQDLLDVEKLEETAE